MSPVRPSKPVVPYPSSTPYPPLGWVGVWESMGYAKARKLCCK